jgi:hypothetical protein
MRVITVVAGGMAVVVAVAGAFAIGRATAPQDPDAAAMNQEIVVQLGDELRVPAVGLFCTTDFEIDRARLLCNHGGNRARYQVVFEHDRTKIGRLGFPGHQRTFPESS